MPIPTNFISSARRMATLILFAPLIGTAQSNVDNSSYSLTTANNGGQVKLRDAPGGSGSINTVRSLATQAQLPADVRNSQLTTGEYAYNIAQLEAVTETLNYLANARPDTYSGAGTIVTSANLEQHRAAIAGNGGTFVFRGTIDIPSKDSLIQVGANTTIWVDGTVRYTGSEIPGTAPDEYSVSDVINGIFEVRGTNNLAKPNVKIFGTKRGKILGNDRLSAVYVRYARDLQVEGLNTDTCRNVLFLNNVYGSSTAKGNFIYNSARRAIHVKASNGIQIINNFIYDADVDGIDIDAYTKNSETLRNLLIDSGSRWMVWTEIASTDNMIDGNVGIHVNGADGGFQENGSESNGQPATARNTWKNNHIFYVDSPSNWKQGFSFHPNRVIDRDSVTFYNNYVWQTSDNAYKRNPKSETLDDVAYYRYVGAEPTPPAFPGDAQNAFTTLFVPGTIQVEDFDTGGENIAYFDTATGNAGNEYRTEDNVDIQSSGDGTNAYNVGWIEDGEWLEYTISSVTAGRYDIDLRYAAIGTTGNKSVQIQLANSQIVSIPLTGTGGWQQWQTVQVKNIDINGGTNQVLRLDAMGGNFNLNWIRFSPSTSSTPVIFTVEAEDFQATGGPYAGFNRYITPAGISAINFNQRGDWADYVVNVPETGNYLLSAWTGTTQSGGAIEVLVNNHPYIHQTVRNNGGWDSFVELRSSTAIPLQAGQQTLRIRGAGNSSSTWEWNADRFVFTKQ
ncbi:carbohydrate-binding protein [uncultured Microbulbifer sp.]|uniref:carbohydrate-binding protein n=1 Tax=uncultured Microbulbifer sp. TaxID=348147 RepID=UPI00260A3E98|nr:carbohydrate-binding protein [uncultured Microbulbifer sp.]